MSSFGEDLIQAMGEALAHAEGKGPAVVHVPVDPREIRVRAKLTQAQMAPLMGMSLSGYRKVGTRPKTGFRARCDLAACDRKGTCRCTAGLGRLTLCLTRRA